LEAAAAVIEPRLNRSQGSYTDLVGVVSDTSGSTGLHGEQAPHRSSSYSLPASNEAVNEVVTMVDCLLAVAGSQWEAEDVSGAVAVAAAKGNWEVLQLLVLEVGGSRGWEGEWLRDPLAAAVEKGRGAVVELLLRVGSGDRGVRKAGAGSGAGAGECAAKEIVGETAPTAAAAAVSGVHQWSSSCLIPALEAAARGEQWNIMQRLLAAMPHCNSSWDPVSLVPVLVSLVTHPEQLMAFLEAAAAAGVHWRGEVLAPVLTAAARKGAVQAGTVLLLQPGVEWRGVHMAAAAVALMSSTTAETFAKAAAAAEVEEGNLQQIRVAHCVSLRGMGFASSISPKQLLQVMLGMAGAGWCEEELAGVLWRAAEFGDEDLVQQLMLMPGVGWSRGGVKLAMEFARKRGLTKSLNLMEQRV
jgi:hypothetical protein